AGISGPLLSVQILHFFISQVRLICTLNGYFPKNLSVEWQQNKQQLTQIQPTERHLQSVEGGEKTYSLTSEIEPNMEEWTRGSNFTCKFIHKENKDEKTTSICHSNVIRSLIFVNKLMIPAVFGFNPPSIHVEIPSFKTVMMTNSDVKARCFIHNVDAKLVWLMDGEQPSTDRVNEFSNKTTLISELTVPSSSWKNLKLLKCKVQHHCFSAEKTVEISDLNPPTVRTVEPSAAELSVSDILTLTCLVSGYFPSNISVHWKENGQKVSSSRYINSPSFKDPDSSSYSMSSRLNVSQTNDKKSTYTCVVRHESSNRPFESSIKDVFGEITVHFQSEYS
uniref:Ig-like domain-containing protein n=1 Tax=Oryzias sinensis TaxID=183150 RepID=A0A8C7Y9N8_9TELE